MPRTETKTATGAEDTACNELTEKLVEPAALLEQIAARIKVIASSVVLICAQRLVKRLYGACEVPAPIPEAWTLGENTSATFFNPRGCEAC